MNDLLPDTSSRKKEKEQISSLNQELEMMRQSEKELQETISEREQQNEELKTENERLTKENKKMKNELDTEEPYDKIFNERRELIQQDKDKTQKIKELESERIELNKSVESLKAEVKTTKAEIEKVKEEYETEKKRVAEVVQERDVLDSRISEIELEKVKVAEELFQLKETTQLEEEEDDRNSTLAEQGKKDEKFAKAYLEDMRMELAEYKSKVENLQLESEALKSENEALFRANESKKKDMDEILGELNSIRNELKIEQQRFIKLKQEWDEEKKKTEFVLVSKSPTKSRNKRTPRIEEEDSEDEHLVSVAEAARAEAEALREKERGLRKRVNQLQIDKEELFRSGTNLFAENKSLKNKYDDMCNERSKLLQAESSLQHKLREKDKEIKDLKKTIDDLYYQNLAIKSNEESESKKNAYVVLMGNEMVKKLEREKSALHRRVKFLERENQEIEQRVIELERQSDALIKYSKKYDKHTPFPPLQGSFDVEKEERRSLRDKPRSGGRERDRTYVRTNSREGDGYSRERRPIGDRHGRDRPPSNHRYKDDRSVSDKQRAHHDYRNDLRPPVQRIRSPDYYTGNDPPFAHQHSRQPSFAHSNQSHSSRLSLPPVANPFEMQRSDTRSDKGTSRRITPLRS